MIRTVIIKTGEDSYSALSARVKHDMPPEQLVRRVHDAVTEFRKKDPKKYAAALVNGRFPWTRLYTHMDQGILLKYGIDLVDYSDGWLNVENDGL